MLIPQSLWWIFFKGWTCDVRYHNMFQWTVNVRILHKLLCRGLGPYQSFRFVPRILFELLQDEPSSFAWCPSYQNLVGLGFGKIIIGGRKRSQKASETMRFAYDYRQDQKNGYHSLTPMVFLNPNQRHTVFGQLLMAQWRPRQSNRPSVNSTLPGELWKGKEFCFGACLWATHPPMSLWQWEVSYGWLQAPDGRY